MHAPSRLAYLTWLYVISHPGLVPSRRSSHQPSPSTPRASRSRGVDGGRGRHRRGGGSGIACSVRCSSPIADVLTPISVRSTPSACVRVCCAYALACCHASVTSNRLHWGVVSTATRQCLHTRHLSVAVLLAMRDVMRFGQSVSFPILSIPSPSHPLPFPKGACGHTKPPQAPIQPTPRRTERGRAGMTAASSSSSASGLLLSAPSASPSSGQGAFPRPTLATLPGAATTWPQFQAAFDDELQGQGRTRPSESRLRLLYRVRVGVRQPRVRPRDSSGGPHHHLSNRSMPRPICLSHTRLLGLPRLEREGELGRRQGCVAGRTPDSLPRPIGCWGAVARVL